MEKLTSKKSSVQSNLEAAVLKGEMEIRHRWLCMDGLSSPWLRGSQKLGIPRWRQIDYKVVAELYGERERKREREGGRERERERRRKVYTPRERGEVDSEQGVRAVPVDQEHQCLG
jgi:hypothetical protein